MNKFGFAPFRDIVNPRLGAKAEEAVIVAFLRARTCVQIFRRAQAGRLENLHKLLVGNNTFAPVYERFGIVRRVAFGCESFAESHFVSHREGK